MPDENPHRRWGHDDPQLHQPPKLLGVDAARWAVSSNPYRSMSLTVAAARPAGEGIGRALDGDDRALG